MKDEKLDEGNCISVSPADGSTFCQPVDFLGRGSGSSIILLYNDKLNNYNGLFLSTVIKTTLQQNYYYSDMESSENIKKEQIKLPVTSSDKPDFSYMETYIKNLQITVDNNLEKIEKFINSL